MLQVAPANRPTANEILQMPEIIKRNKFSFNYNIPELLDTIRISNDVPQNLSFTFPESKYYLKKSASEVPKTGKFKNIIFPDINIEKNNCYNVLPDLKNKYIVDYKKIKRSNSHQNIIINNNIRNIKTYKIENFVYPLAPKNESTNNKNKKTFD